MRKLRVGFVGTGFIAHFHLKAMEQVRAMELVGVLASQGADKLAAAASRAGMEPPTIFKSVEQMANAVDAIAIYCPNFARLEIMEAIVEAKKKGAPVMGVLCDKPLGRNVQEAKRMVELANEGGLKTAYFENQIHMKPIQVQKLQLLPQEKTMGPLSLTRSAEEHGGPHMPWFWDPIRQGGGVLSDMGCHSIAVGWYVLTPHDRPLNFLKPKTVSCDLGLLKWGQPRWRDDLKRRMGVDYSKTPAEDFATGIVTYENPETKQLVKAQFTDSWMFEKQGLRLFMDGMGPGYAFEINTLISPLSIFIGDTAAETLRDSEAALEKSTSSRGLLAVQYNEADLYGYVEENKDAAESFLAGRDALLSFEYGLEITKLVMASYLSAEKGKTIDLTHPSVQSELESYVPLIQQGRGADLLY